MSISYSNLKTELRETKKKLRAAQGKIKKLKRAVEAAQSLIVNSRAREGMQLKWLSQLDGWNRRCDALKEGGK